MLFQQPHSVLYLLIYALSTPPIVGLFKALQADGRDKILDPQHFPAKRLVNQRSIGEGEKFAVGVHFAQGNQVFLPHHRFVAGVDIHICTQLFALAHNFVNGFQAQVQLMAVLRRPTAGTVEVASRSGVKQDRPRDVAALPLPDFLLQRTSFERGVDNKILKERLSDTVIQLIGFQQELIPIPLFVNGFAERGPLALVPAVRQYLVHQAHSLGNILLWVLFQIVERSGNSGRESRVLNRAKNVHFVLSPNCLLTYPKSHDPTDTMRQQQ